MEEEHSSNEYLPSNSHRLQIRRNIIRTLRSSPYNSSLIRRQQQHSLITSQTINNLITNIDNNNIQTDVNQDETEIIEDPDHEVFVDLSNASPIENNNSNHSLSTVDFDPEDDEHHYYYYHHHHPSTTEPIIIPDNPINLIQYPYDDEDEYSSSINNNNNNEEDLSIEIILESSQNNSLSRRRRSIIPFNNHGLRLTDILSIPQKLYSSLKQQNNEKYSLNTQCYICLEDFQLIDSIKILHCEHIFHTACINEWLRSHSNCAYCRTAVVVDVLRTTTRRRQRTRARRNILRTSTSNSIESSTLEQSQL